MGELAARFGSENVICLIKPEDSDFERAGRSVLQGHGVETIPADIRTWQPMPEEINSFDVLFHLAASTSSQSLEHSSNDEGTENLLRVLGPRLSGTRVLYVSSTAVYDPKGRTMRGLDESSPCTPRTEYGRTKLRGENIVQMLQPAYKFDYIIFRLSTTYGPNVRADGLFSLFGDWVRRNHFISRIPWPGKLGIVHIDDVVRILVTFAQDPRAANDTFCIATESPSIVEIASYMARSLGAPYKPFKVPESVWTIVRMGMRFPGLFKLLPWPIAGKLWRLSHMIDNGFWCDGSKLARHYREPLVTLDKGIGSVLARRKIANGSDVSPNRRPR